MRTILALPFALFAAACSSTTSNPAGNDADGADGASCLGACTLDAGGDAPSADDSSTSSDAPVEAAPDPSIIATAANAVDDLHIDATRIYWIEQQQQILSMPLAGGASKVIVPAPASSGGQIWRIAIDASNVYWTDPSGGRQNAGGVYAAPLDGSGMPALLAHATGPLNLSVDGGYVYFTFQNGVARVSTSGGSATILAEGLDAQTPILGYNGYLYLAYPANTPQTEQVYRVAGDSIAPTSDAGDAGSPPLVGDGGVLTQISMNGRFSTLILAPRADLNDVYWAVYDLVFRWDVDAGAQTMLGQVSDPLNPMSGGSVESMYPSKGDVYWTSSWSGSGDLWKFASGGDPRQHLAYGESYIRGLAVDDQYVYFADGQRIRRVSR
jgi:hypothetical protein